MQSNSGPAPSLRGLQVPCCSCPQVGLGVTASLGANSCRPMNAPTASQVGRRNADMSMRMLRWGTLPMGCYSVLLLELPLHSEVALVRQGLPQFPTHYQHRWIDAYDHSNLYGRCWFKP